MIKISVVKQANYPVSAANIKKKLNTYFTKNGISSTAEVSVAIVGEKRMRELSAKYLKDNKTHSVLSFTPDEVKDKFVYPPDGTIHLGEILVCYPAAVQEAQKEARLIDEAVYKLIEHGAGHLLGFHHE